VSDDDHPHALAPRLLGAVLAGGRSSRYGRPKAMERVGGRGLAERARDALQAVAARVALLSGDSDLAAALQLEDRPDRVPGSGPLGAITGGVSWAAETGYEGVLVLACDLPFVSPDLLRLLLAAWDGEAVVLPASLGPLGVEPLVAAYPVTLLPDMERLVAEGVRSMSAALDRLPTKTLPLDRISAVGDPRHLFLNVNRPEDRDRAERALASERG